MQLQALHFVVCDVSEETPCFTQLCYRPILLRSCPFDFCPKEEVWLFPGNIFSSSLSSGFLLPHRRLSTAPLLPRPKHSKDTEKKLLEGSKPNLSYEAIKLWFYNKKALFFSCFCTYICEKSVTPSPCFVRKTATKFGCSWIHKSWACRLFRPTYDVVKEIVHQISFD